MYKGTETLRKYKHYNEKFQLWFDNQYGKRKEIEEDQVREFIFQEGKKGKDTNMLVAALKFRFNQCEKKDFRFTRLA
jgi:hypothetical protein